MTAAIIRLYECLPSSLIVLLARILTGLIFFKSGLTKIDGFSIRPATFFLFENEYKIRLPKYLGLTDVEFNLPFAEIGAYVGTMSELIMPLLLWLGLGARFAATVLLGMTVIIEMVYPNSYIDHGLWAVALLFIMWHGAGLFSVDHIIRRRQSN